MFSGAHRSMWLHLRFRKMCGFHWFDALSLYSYDPQHFLSFVSTWKLHLLRLNCGRRSSRLSRTIEYTTVFRTSRLAYVVLCWREFYLYRSNTTNNTVSLNRIIVFENINRLECPLERWDRISIRAF